MARYLLFAGMANNSHNKLLNKDKKQLVLLLRRLF
jgi:hypothetical protein